MKKTGELDTEKKSNLEISENEARNLQYILDIASKSVGISNKNAQIAIVSFSTKIDQLKFK